MYADLIIVLGVWSLFGLALAAADVPPAVAGWWRRRPPVVRDLLALYGRLVDLLTSGRPVPSAGRPDGPDLHRTVSAAAGGTARSGPHRARRDDLPDVAGHAGAGAAPAAPRGADLPGLRPTSVSGRWR